MEPHSVAMIRMFLEDMDIDCEEGVPDEVLKKTPSRFVNAFEELLGKHDASWEFTTFEADNDEMIIEKGIPFVSLCEHHMLPFLGHAHVGYLPRGRQAGLSKLARCVRSCSRGLWTQERLTTTIAKELVEKLDPIGVAVVLEAEHTCMTIRGVKAPGVKTITSAMTGAFRDKTNNARLEFLGLIK